MLVVWALRQVRRQKRFALEFAAASAVAAGAHAVFAALAAEVASTLAGAHTPMDGRSIGAWLLTGSNRGSDAGFIAWLALGVALTKGAANLVAARRHEELLTSISVSLRSHLFRGMANAMPNSREVDGLHSLRHTRHADHGAHANQADSFPAESVWARAVASLTAHQDEIERGISQGLLRVLRASLELVPIVAALVWLSPTLFALAALTFLVVGAPAVAGRRHLRREVTTLGAQREALLDTSDEAVRHIDLWRSFGKVQHVATRLESLGDALARLQTRIGVIAAGLSAFNEVVASLVLVLLCFAQARLANDLIPQGVMLRFLVLLFLGYKPLRDLTDGRLALLRGQSAFRRAVAMMPQAGELAQPAQHTHPTSAPARTWPLAPLTCREVRATVGSVTLNVQLAPGSVVALMGPTGSGKTSTLRVLLGLAPREHGRIIYAGEDLDALAPESRPFAWVPQEVPLLHGTLRANIELGGAMTAEDALAAVHAPPDLLAQLDEMTRPLSGGERQWVALARAIALQRPVLLLDEPCSAMDAASEARFLHALAGLRTRHTILFTTHRESLAAAADRVLRLGSSDASDMNVLQCSA
jgi:ABC-type multidrug transport system fused ATPase/permease subunit